MPKSFAWLLAAGMLAAAVWIVRGTQDGSAEPELAAQLAPDAPRAPAPEPAAPKRSLPARDAAPPPARVPAARAPAVELGNAPQPPETRGTGPVRPPLSGSGGGAGGAPGVVAGEAPQDVAGLPTQPPQDVAGLPTQPPQDVDPPGGSTPAEEPAANCALQLGLWGPQEIEARAALRMRRTGENIEEARIHVLALLAVGYQRAVAQLGADAPPAVLKARAEQISFLSASLPPESYQEQLALAGNCQAPM